MNSDEIKSKIKQIIHQTTNIDPETLKDDARFVEDLDLDSLSRMEIAVNVDQAFQLDFPEEEMDRLVTLQATVELVEEYLARNQAA